MVSYSCARVCTRVCVCVFVLEVRASVLTMCAHFLTSHIWRFLFFVLTPQTADRRTAF